MKNKRPIVIAIIMLAVVIATCACMFGIFNSVKTPASAQIAPTPTATPRVILVSTPRPEWTPIPGWGNLVNYQVVPLKK
jgi:flagellar basal body-associated protein FliL